MLCLSFPIMYISVELFPSCLFSSNSCSSVVDLYNFKRIIFYQLKALGRTQESLLALLRENYYAAVTFGNKKCL